MTTTTNVITEIEKRIAELVEKANKLMEESHNCEDCSFCQGDDDGNYVVCPYHEEELHKLTIEREAYEKDLALIRTALKEAEAEIEWELCSTIGAKSKGVVNVECNCVVCKTVKTILQAKFGDGGSK